MAHRRCNSTKGDMTAYDFMNPKSLEVFNEYVERVNALFADKIISKFKRDKLLMSEDQIPDNFIDRQLRKSQYIAKKVREILQTICRNVWSTSGTQATELCHLWGWDDIIMNLQLPKYKALRLIEIVEWESEHSENKHSKEVIKDWTKCDEHRHLMIKNTDDVWNKIWEKPENTYLHRFLEQLPPAGLNLELSMQQNKMFILGMSNDEIKIAIESKNYRQISEHLYRVQKLTGRNAYLPYERK